MTFDTVSLNEVSDSELTELLAVSGKGKPAIYREPINALLALADGCNVTGAVPYLEINPAAKDRTVVLAGMKAAIKKHETANGRMFVRANSDEDKVTVIIAK